VRFDGVDEHIVTNVLPGDWIADPVLYKRGLDGLFQVWPLLRAIFLVGMAVTIVPIIGDRSRHRPGNVAPIQLISSVGAWALVILQESVLVAALRESSWIVATASGATLVTLLCLFLRRSEGRVVRGRAPETLSAIAGEIEQILGRASRIGLESFKVVIVEGGCPFIGVSVSQQGHVIVRVRQELMPWLERHQRPMGAGADAVGSLLRFTVLHELGHVLNRDHLTHRVIRSVLVAHLWWIPAAAAGVVLLPWRTSAGSAALLTSFCLLPPFLAQCLLTRRFIAEREEVADVRAIQTLDPSDAARLTARGRRSARPAGPTLLEKLMADLRVQAPLSLRRNPMSAVVRRIWPEGGNFHERCERLAEGHASRPAQPGRWAAGMGMQCGLLAVSLLSAISAAWGRLPVWSPGLALKVTLTVISLICSMAATYCGMRVDPALVRFHDVRKTPARRSVGAIYYLCFATTVFLLAAFPAVPGMVRLATYRTLALAVAVSAVHVGLGTLAARATVQTVPDGAVRALRPSVLRAGPSIVVALAVIAFCSAFAVWVLGLSRAGGVVWLGLGMVGIAGINVSIGATRSTNAVVRALPPMSLLNSPGNIYAIRILWRDFYFDRARVANGRIGVLALSVFAGMAFSFMYGAVLCSRAIHGGAAGNVAFQDLLIVCVVLVVLEILVPKHKTATSPLLDLETVQMFDNLLTATRIANLPEAGKLSRSLAYWVKNDPTLPYALLPEQDSIWRLEALLPLVRIAKTAGEEERVAGWRPLIRDALRSITTGGAVTLNGLRPSLDYTVLAAQIIDEAGLASELPLEPLLDSISRQLEQWLKYGKGASADGIASAYRLLMAHGRATPSVDRLRMRSIIGVEYLLSGPIIRANLCEIVAFTSLLESTAVRDQLMSVVLSRMWEALQLNPEQDVSLLLDCYLAAVSLGEKDSPYGATAELALGGIANHMVDELTKVCGSAV
jgi:hypothetical protein